MSTAHPSHQGVPFRERVPDRPHFRCWSSVPAAVARHALPPVKRVPREQGRHVIYRHSGCRKPAVISRRPMLPGFGTHLHVGETGAQFGTDQMSAAGPHIVCSSALHWGRAVCTPWACKCFHMNVKAHTVRAARHHAGLVCIATCVQRALDSGREF